jgi:hypothetical protein
MDRRPRVYTIAVKIVWIYFLAHRYIPTTTEVERCLHPAFLTATPCDRSIYTGFNFPPTCEARILLVPIREEMVSATFISSFSEICTTMITHILNFE